MSFREQRGLIDTKPKPKQPLEDGPMAITMSLASALDAAPAQVGPITPEMPPVPTTRSVPSLDAALRTIRRLGGTVTSETRTAPGIGSWAFVATADGAELVVWEDAATDG